MNLGDFIYALEGESDKGPLHESQVELVIVTKDGGRFTPEACACDGEVMIVNAKLEDGYRLWVNDARTLLVRLFDEGTIEVARRDDPSHTWGPPMRLTEER